MHPRIAGQDAGIVHHLAQAQYAFIPREAGQVGGEQRGAGRIEVRRGHAGGYHHVDVERNAVGSAEHPVDAVVAEDVGYLVGIGDDRRGAARGDHPGVFDRGQEARFDMDMRVDQARAEVPASQIQGGLGLEAVVDADDVALVYRYDSPVDDRDRGKSPRSCSR